MSPSLGREQLSPLTSLRFVAASLKAWRRTWHWKLALTLLLVYLMIALGNAGHFPASALEVEGFRTIFPLQIHPFARLFEFTLVMSATLAWCVLASRRPLGFWAGSICEILTVILVMQLMLNTESWADAAGQQTWIGDAGWTWLRAGGIPALGFAILITVLVLQQGVVSRALSIPLFVILGEISYSIFLVHQIPVRHCLSYAQSFGMLPPALLLCSFIILTLLLSHVIWSLVERPLRRLIITWWTALGENNARNRPNKADIGVWRNAARHIASPVVIAVVALLELIVPIAYLKKFRVSIDQVTPAYAGELAQSVSKRFRDVAIGRFILVGAELRPSADGEALELVRRISKRQRLDYTVAIHVVDARGQILSNFDRPQDPAAPWIDAGTIWKDIVHLPASQFGREQRGSRWSLSLPRRSATRCTRAP